VFLNCQDSAGIGRAQEAIHGAPEWTEVVIMLGFNTDQIDHLLFKSNQMLP